MSPSEFRVDCERRGCVSVEGYLHKVCGRLMGFDKRNKLWYSTELRSGLCIAKGKTRYETRLATRKIVEANADVWDDKIHERMVELRLEMSLNPKMTV